MDAKAVIQKLKDGNHRYVHNKLEGRRRCKDRRTELIEEQHPYAVILSCADSRVIPALIFDVGLGDLFVIRVAGNVASISTIASIEYAVANLGAELIIVMGHQNCGAVRAAIAGEDYGPHLNQLVKYIQPAIDSFEGDLVVDDVVRKNVQVSVEDLRSKSEIISKALESGKVDICSAYYRLDSGEVDFLSSE